MYKRQDIYFLNIQPLFDKPDSFYDITRAFHTFAVIRCYVRLAFRCIDNQLGYAVNILVSQLDMTRKTDVYKRQESRRYKEYR